MTSDTYLHHIINSIDKGIFLKIKVTFEENEASLKTIIITCVTIKQQAKYSFVYTYATKDITKNYDKDAMMTILSECLKQDDVKQMILFTLEKDWHLKKTQDGAYQITNHKPAHPPVKNRHDKEKRKNLDTQAPFLYHLGLTNRQGDILKSAQDKYRQIEHYLALLATPIATLLALGRPIHIVDMGAGKGYLTFALYHYIQRIGSKASVSVTGVEYRQELVQLCNDIAKQCGYTQLTFLQGTIADAPIDHADMVIALHACDTATDDAIIKGINWGAQLIVVAPCCQKQVRQDMNLPRSHAALKPILQHGILLEKQASMITDVIRAEMLNYYSYKTKIVEFISDAHTPKNIMIIASKTNKPQAHRDLHLSNIEVIKNQYGLGKHYLEKILSQE